MSERLYELLYIARPTLQEAEAEALTEQIKGFLEAEGADVQKVEPWGRKRLAYEVDRQREGYYTLLVFEGAVAAVKEVERRLKVTDGVLRHIFVRVDEDLKRAENRKQQRAEREAKKKARQTARRAAVEGEGGAAL